MLHQIAVLAVAAAAHAQVVPAGIDLWTTPGVETSTQDFSANPLPAGFFGPGSDPFGGVIEFTGLDLNDNPGLEPIGEDLGMTDTVVERLGDMNFDNLPAQEVPIQIVALSLVSTQPIQVTYGDEDPEHWHVEIQLSGLDTPPGTLKAVKEDDKGGSFTCSLHVSPFYIFINAEDPFDLRFLQVPPNSPLAWDILIDDGRFAFTPLPETFILDHEVMLANGQVLPPMADNFFPSVGFSSLTGDPGCILSTFHGQPALHLAFHPTPLPEIEFPDTDGDGVIDICDNCPLVYNPFQDDANGDLIGDLCDCPADFNGDGVLNILDFVAYQNAFTNGDQAADCNGDGVLNILDFVCFQNLFGQGC